MSRPKNVAVIGAGVVGATCALSLARQGFKVTVYECNKPGHGCSFGNGAQYNVGSALPMAYPGVVNQGIRWLFDSAGPVNVSWKQLPMNLKWFYHFYRTSQLPQWVETYRHLHALNSPCVELYKEYLGEDLWAKTASPSGALHVWRSSQPGALDAEISRQREKYGVPFEMVDQAKIRELEPALSNDFTRGIFFPGSGYVFSSVGLVENLLNAAVALGVQVNQGYAQVIVPTFQGIEVSTGNSVLKYDAVVVAAGYSSKRIASRLGMKINMVSERGYNVTYPNLSISISRPVTDAESAVVATPVAEGLRMVGIADFDRFDAGPDERQPEKLMKKFRAMFPGLEGADHSTWMGIRPSMPDSLPVIDHHPKIKNLIFATGHGHMGISGAPMTAALVTDMLMGKQPRISMERFKIR